MRKCTGVGWDGCRQQLTLEFSDGETVNMTVRDALELCAMIQSTVEVIEANPPKWFPQDTRN